MRRRRKGFVVLAALGLLCAVPLVLPTGAAASTCDEAYVNIDGDTIVVSPTGTNDTTNLQCALDAAAAMPWAHVVLESGDYFTDFLEVVDFHGVFRGAGQEETTIRTLPEGLDCIAQSQARRMVSLLVFGGGDIEVVDLGFAVGGRTSCEAPWASQVNDDGSGWVAWDLDAALQFAPGVAPVGTCPPPGTQDITVDAIQIEGIWPNYQDAFRVFRGFFGGIFAGGDPLRGCPDTRSSGDVAVTTSAFARIPQPVAIAWLDDSTVLLADNSIRTAADGPIFQDMSNTTAIVQNNLIEDAWFNGMIGFTRADLAGEYPFDLQLLDNRIELRNSDGIWIVDNARAVTGQTMVNTLISGNDIVFDYTDYSGIHIVGAGGGTITENTITGVGRAGIWIAADRWLVSRNDLASFDAYLADIWLTADSARNRVRCSSQADTVLDEGVRNVIRGCSPVTTAGETDSNATTSDLTVATDTRKGEFLGAMMRR